MKSLLSGFLEEDLTLTHMLGIIFNSLVGLVIGENLRNTSLELSIEKTLNLVHEENFLDEILLLEFLSKPVSLDGFFGENKLTRVDLARFQIKCSVDVDGGIFWHSCEYFSGHFSGDGIESDLGIQLSGEFLEIFLEFFTVLVQNMFRSLLFQDIHLLFSSDDVDDLDAVLGKVSLQHSSQSTAGSCADDTGNILILNSI